MPFVEHPLPFVAHSLPFVEYPLLLGRSNRDYQKWLIATMLAFLDLSGGGGFAWDHGEAERNY